MNLTDFIKLIDARDLSTHKCGAGWQARCPGHDDRNASLSIAEGKDGRILLRCHAGCSAESIVSALGFKLADLFPNRITNDATNKPRIVVTYDYHDETGKLLFQCVRFEPKDFRQRRPNPARPGEWVWNLKDTRRVLYRLREVKAVVISARTVFVVEGEKDANALVEHGFVATCNPMGAGKWLPEHTETLGGAVRVVVIADKDTPGRNHAQAVATSLHSFAKSVKLIELPDINGKPVKDTFDFLTAGGTANELRKLVKAAPEFVPAVGPQPTKSGCVVSEYMSPGEEAGDRSTDEAALNRLAALPLLEYERCRDNEAKRLKIRVATLDTEVQKCRTKSGEILQGGALNLADVELWSDTVNGADILARLAETFSRYVALPAGAADALVLWTAHAHCFEYFQCSPRLNISSPEKGCGKSTLRDVVSVLVPRPLPTENLSVAVLFRVIESRKPTVLADEYDAWLRDNDELRGIFNAGHRRGGQALRCEGESNEVRAFNVFAPAVLCGIGALPGTLHDRSIIIRLERAKPGELSERFDSRRVDRETELCRKLARWCVDNAAQLETCDPVMPQNAFNRLADNWRPLFAIAEVAGGDWPQRAVDAFMKLTGKVDWDAQDIGTMLLADIKQVFMEASCERMFSKNLIEKLSAMSDRPWPEAHRGKPITETWLARRLRSFGINSRTLRIGDERAKGYETAHFAEAFERYLYSSGVFKRDTRDNAITTDTSCDFQSVTPGSRVTDTEANGTLANTELSRRHASPAPVPEEREEMLI